MPEVTCLKGNLDLPSDVTCSKTASSVVVAAQTAKVEHGGNYVIKAKNVAGEDTCSFKLTVAGALRGSYFLGRGGAGIWNWINILLFCFCREN